MGWTLSLVAMTTASWPTDVVGSFPCCHDGSQLADWWGGLFPLLPWRQPAGRLMWWALSPLAMTTASWPTDGVGSFPCCHDHNQLADWWGGLFPRLPWPQPAGRLMGWARSPVAMTAASWPTDGVDSFPCFHDDSQLADWCGGLFPLLLWPQPAGRLMGWTLSPVSMTTASWPTDVVGSFPCCYDHNQLADWCGGLFPLLLWPQPAGRLMGWALSPVAMTAASWPTDGVDSFPCCHDHSQLADWWGGLCPLLPWRQLAGRLMGWALSPVAMTTASWPTDGVGFFPGCHDHSQLADWWGGLCPLLPWRQLAGRLMWWALFPVAMTTASWPTDGVDSFPCCHDHSQLADWWGGLFPLLSWPQPAGRLMGWTLSPVAMTTASWPTDGVNSFPCCHDHSQLADWWGGLFPLFPWPQSADSEGPVIWRAIFAFCVQTRIITTFNCQNCATGFTTDTFANPTPSMPSGQCLSLTDQDFRCQSTPHPSPNTGAGCKCTLQNDDPVSSLWKSLTASFPADHAVYNTKVSDNTNCQSQSKFLNGRKWVFAFLSPMGLSMITCYRFKINGKGQRYQCMKILTLVWTLCSEHFIIPPQHEFDWWSGGKKTRLIYLPCAYYSRLNGPFPFGQGHAHASIPTSLSMWLLSDNVAPISPKGLEY